MYDTVYVFIWEKKVRKVYCVDFKRRSLVSMYLNLHEHSFVEKQTPYSHLREACLAQFQHTIKLPTVNSIFEVKSQNFL